MKVLIVDDEKDLCLLLSSFLRKKAAEVSVANTLQMGFEKLEALSPDLIFLDNNLPDGTGLEALPQWRQRHPGGCIVMISAMSNLREKALACGADAFIEKPLSLGIIENVIHSRTA